MLRILISLYTIYAFPEELRFPQGILFMSNRKFRATHPSLLIRLRVLGRCRVLLQGSGAHLAQDQSQPLLRAGD